MYVRIPATRASLDADVTLNEQSTHTRTRCLQHVRALAHVPIVVQQCSSVEIELPSSGGSKFPRSRQQSSAKTDGETRRKLLATKLCRAVSICVGNTKNELPHQ